MAVLLTSIVISTSTSAGNFIRSDANADGEIDISDPVSTLFFLFLGDSTLGCEDAADSNDDGEVDIADATFALTFIFQNGDLPAEPYPNCGTDPTSDGLGCELFTPCGSDRSDAFEIAIGDFVSEGIPGPGAGKIEAAGAVDTYTFEAAAGTSVYFDELSNNFEIRWRCVDEDGQEVFATNGIAAGLDVGPVVLTRGGTYTITVFGAGDGSGPYSFTILELPPIEEFEISIGDVVSDGVPGAGAGNIESPGALDAYRFSAAAGSNVFFDELSNSFNLHWRCVDEIGVEVFGSNAIASGSDVGVIHLARGGTYTITVFGNGDGRGVYSFTIREIPPPEEFVISLGETVTNGAPQAGAGNIETPGAVDIYRFQAAAGAKVYFDELSNNFSLRWQCTDENGLGVFAANNFVASLDVGTIILTRGGTYTITVFGSGDGFGAYSFRILAVPPPEEFEISSGDTVASGVPLAGAGNIETPGAVDIYRFSVAAGTCVYFGELSNNFNHRWRCTDEGGLEIFAANNFLTASEVGAIDLTRGGTYTITVFGIGDVTGTYSFQLSSCP